MPWNAEGKTECEYCKHDVSLKECGKCKKECKCERCGHCHTYGCVR